MKWDLENPFVCDIRVRSEDIDELGHANNAVYVRWLERCAWEHSGALGLGLPEYQQLNRAMVVVRHEIDYLAAAYLEEELQMGTWIVSWDSKLRMSRQFQLCRPHDGATLLRAHTTFACVELSSGRPRRMPREFIEQYCRAIVSA
ncbi:MAG: thioesterase family protein [Pseudomonas sp.]